MLHIDTSSSRHKAFSRSLPPLPSSTRTVYAPQAAGPRSLWHPCVPRLSWWIQVVGGRPQARLHSCDGRLPSPTLVQIQRIWLAGTVCEILATWPKRPSVRLWTMNDSAPDISPLESLLPWSICTTLAQLRSGHCRLLNSHKAHITSGISDVCPECGVAPHSIEHLFNCQSHPTQLTVQDIWDNPAAVADFLNQDNWR